MKINPYLFFDGTCEEAFAFYAQCLGGETEALVRFSDMPADEAEMPPGVGERIMHVCLALDGQMLMGSDAMPGQPHEGMKGAYVALQVDTPVQAEDLFAALGEGATVVMAMEETFWAHRFGMLVDRFGVNWMINCNKEP